MAFPTVINSATSTDASGANTSIPTLPTSIVTGRLLLGFSTNAQGGSGMFISGTGWSMLSTGVDSNSVMEYAAYAKIAGASNTINLSSGTGSGTFWAHIVYQIDGWSGLISDIGSSASASSDPPSLSMGANRSHLWIASYHALGLAAGSSAPSSYTGFLSSIDVTDDVEVFTAERALQALVEDPGPFGGGTPTAQSSVTVGIRPTVLQAPPTNRARLIRASHW